MRANTLADFWKKVDRSDRSGCWIWKGRIQTQGYGQVRLKEYGRPMVAHRIAYEQQVGPIPEGLTLDHLCRNRSCVNPAHLEPVTHRENILRGIGLSAENARKTHCKRGHEFTPENTRVTVTGGRACRVCQRLYDQSRGPGWSRRRVAS